MKNPARLLRLAAYLAAGLAAFFVFKIAHLYFQQDSLIFVPSAEWIATPVEAGMPFQDISFQSADGVRLSGWFVQGDPDQEAVLICHGNARNISYRLRDMRVFHDLGYSVFIFDYRGYGKSGGKPSEKGTQLDAEAAWQFLVDEKGFPTSMIILCGRSLGAAVAAKLAVEKNPRALIVESGFTSLTELARLRHPWLPVRLFLRHRFETLPLIRRLKCPLLVVHSPEDAIVPYAHGRALFKAAPELKRKRFLMIEGTHNEGYYLSEARYEAALKNFL